MSDKTLKDYTRIVVEVDNGTEESEPIAIITADETIAMDGYRVRLTPVYD